MKKLVKGIGLLAGGAALFFAVIPLAIYRILHLGVAALLVLGAGLLALVLLWDAFPDRYYRGYPPQPAHWWGLARRGLALCLGVALALAGVCSLGMAHSAWWEKPREGEEATVVVLGCLVRGREPSLMLRYRLDAAADYLLAHPQVPVIVSGGQGPREEISEAQAMETYLVEQGVAKERIYREDQSTSTRENLEFSARVLREKALPQQLVLVSDSFHLYRGGLYARRQGLEAQKLAGKTPWGLLPSYWAREFFAIAKAELLER